MKVMEWLPVMVDGVPVKLGLFSAMGKSEVRIRKERINPDFSPLLAPQSALTKRFLMISSLL